MKVLLYNELNPKKIPNFQKIRKFIETDDFRSAEVKKIGDNLYRARLDKSNRLLFSLYKYEGSTYALLLEFIENHAYDKSRFLKGGATIDEDKIPDISEWEEADADQLIYLNETSSSFNLLDKIISFDTAQQDIYTINPPLIIIGSAGSGKTVLTLEKMKQAIGEILYITRSPYLVHNSRNLYYALDYTNEDQEISFLSFDDYLASIRVPQGKEMPFRAFSSWFSRHKVSKNQKDPYQIFEEFKGVITGPAERAYLNREEYLALGIKQSIFQQEERGQVYDLFEKYLSFMKTEGYYDSNILSYEYLQEVEPRYDFIVVDEVQDLTNVQLQVILKALRDPHHFILCGDSNQIVHPNFFSWSKIKSLFYKQEQTGSQKSAELIRVLNTNYRNSPEVTEIANRILKIKTSRFGSVDKESNYLVHSNAHNTGTVILLAEEEKLLQELNKKTKQSIRFAVIVMHPEQKVQAKQYFNTPLVFSIQEAKGLEYENIILFNFTSSEEQRFREITSGVDIEDLQGDELRYSRAKDKSDKSLEIYKFHVNALYVAVTRAVKNIYMIEKNPTQRLFELLELRISETGLDLGAYQSSLEEWRREAHKLEMQGKEEQAEEIRTQILKLKTVPWQVLKGETLETLYREAILEGNKKAKLLLFEYALVYNHQGYLNDLEKADFNPAKHPERGIKPLNQKYYLIYESKKTNGVMRKIEDYGVDFRNEFNQTPLMISCRVGNAQAVKELIEEGADTNLINNAGLNAFQTSLEQAAKDKAYTQRKLPAIYKLLEPDNITVQTNGRLYQLDNRLMEFLMLNLMIVMFYTNLGNKIIKKGEYFTSGDFAEILKHFPEHILPERRKKRQYISSILSKNEVDRDDKYNRRLFFRMRRGNYIINPKLSLRVEGEWINIYDLLNMDMVDFEHFKDFDLEYSQRVNHHLKKKLKEFKDNIQKIIDEA
ncbi:MAG: PhoH family protein [Leptospiraceae bacterium]|nr:PhoH family protein [Leptospiraceae bacterium]MCP5495836.1 PhoH family protein [Leptospiraceae bacterium]